MAKLHEVMSREIGATFELKGVEIVLDRFDLAKMAQYEEEGFSINDIITNITEKPSLWGTKVAFDLLTEESKEEFNNDIKVFRKILTFDDLALVVTAVNDAIVSSMPVEKKKKKKPSAKNVQTGEKK